jgi:hypothetical protein
MRGGGGTYKNTRARERPAQHAVKAALLQKLRHEPREARSIDDQAVQGLHFGVPELAPDGGFLQELELGRGAVAAGQLADHHHRRCGLL